MRKLFTLLVLATLLSANQWHGAVVDEAQNDKIFGDNFSDMNKAFSDPSIVRMTRCPDVNGGDCTAFFSQVMRTFTQRVKINLSQQLSRWQETNRALEKQRKILSNLPQKQIEILATEQTKLNKIKEVKFNLTKLLNLENVSGETLKAKSLLTE